MNITPRIKLIFLLLLLKCSSSMAVLYIYDDIPGREYCPDGILPARSIEQLVDNLMLLFQQSFDKEDYGLNDKNLKCFFNEENFYWVKFSKKGYAELTSQKKAEWGYLMIETRVEGQMFLFKIDKSRSSHKSFWVTLAGVENNPDVALTRTIKKYFPNLEINLNHSYLRDGPPFGGDRSQYDFFSDSYLEQAKPHIDIARGKKIVKGKLHNGEYKFRYRKYLTDGKCFHIPKTDRMNCSYKEKANLFKLDLHVDFN